MWGRPSKRKPKAEAGKLAPTDTTAPTTVLRNGPVAPTTPGREPRPTRNQSISLGSSVTTHPQGYINGPAPTASYPPQIPPLPYQTYKQAAHSPVTSQQPVNHAFTSTPPTFMAEAPGSPAPATWHNIQGPPSQQGDSNAGVAELPSPAPAGQSIGNISPTQESQSNAGIEQQSFVDGTRLEADPTIRHGTSVASEPQPHWSGASPAVLHMAPGSTQTMNYVRSRSNSLPTSHQEGVVHPPCLTPGQSPQPAMPDASAGGSDPGEAVIHRSASMDVVSSVTTQPNSFLHPPEREQAERPPALPPRPASHITHAIAGQNAYPHENPVYQGQAPVQTPWVTQNVGFHDPSAPAQQYRTQEQALGPPHGQNARLDDPSDNEVGEEGTERETWGAPEGVANAERASVQSASTQKKPGRLTKAKEMFAVSSPGGGRSPFSDLESRAKEALKPFGVKKATRGLDWISTALTWFPDTLVDAERELLGRREEVKKLTSDLATANDNSRWWHEKWSELDEKHRRARDSLRNLKDRAEQQAETVQVLQGELESLRHAHAKLGDEHSRLTRQAAQDNATWRQRLQDETQRLQDETKRLTEAKDNAVKDVKSTMNQEINKLKTKIQGQNQRIASYSRENYDAIPDKTLAQAFENITQQVSNLASCVPRPEGYSSSGPLPLDPDDFLGRNELQGSRNWPRLLKNVCWRLLAQAFFQYPFGFGALGSSGEGFDRLFAFYEYFARPDPTDPHRNSLVIANDKDTNAWRARTFEAIRRDVSSPTAAATSSDSGPQKRLTVLFQQHVASVAAQLYGALQELGGNALGQQIHEQVRSIVGALAILALDLGSQRAHVAVETCGHRQRLGDNGGGKFQDERDAWSADAVVDLMTQPCLVRIGDGSENLTSVKVLVRGKFVSVKPSPAAYQPVDAFSVEAGHGFESFTVAQY